MVGSKDMSTWVFGAERWSNLIYYSLGGHKDIMVGCFFEKDSLDVSVLSGVSPSALLCVQHVLGFSMCPVCVCRLEPACGCASFTVCELKGYFGMLATRLFVYFPRV